MSASELLENLIKAKILDDKLIDRLRRQIEEPGKNVKPKSIVRFLIEKGLIDEAQGNDLLAGKPIVPHLVSDDQFEEPPAPPREYDTDDLTNVVGNLAGGNTASPPAKPAREVEVPEPREKTPEPVSAKTGAKSGSRSKKEKRRAEKETRMMDMDDVLELPGADPAEEDSRSFASSMEKTGTVTGAATFKGKRDTTDQWNTRWLWGGFGLLLALIVALAVLYLGVLRSNSEEMFAEAEQMYVEGAYGKAAEKFDEFIKKFPKHDDANKALVRSVNSKIRHPFNAKDYKQAANVATTLLPTVTDNEKFGEDLRPDLGVMLPVIALWFSEKPLDEKDVSAVKARLAEANKIVEELIEPRVYMDNTTRQRTDVAARLTKIENNLKSAQGILDKEDRYAEVTAKIQVLTTEGKTEEAFREYTRMIRDFPDLNARPGLREQITKVSQREIELVQPVTDKIPTTAGPRPSPVVSQLLTGSTLGKPADSVSGEILPVLAEGAVYGVETGTGRLLWRYYVGLPTTIQPMWASETSMESLIVCDQQDNVVSRLNANTGEAEWTATVGEFFYTPCLDSGSVFIATRSGKLLRLDLKTGEQIAGCKLPRGLSSGCEVAESTSTLFAVGVDSNIYIVDSQTLECRDVYYLGHGQGAVAISPVFWSGHLLIPVNGDNFSILNVLRPDETGKWLPLQTIDLADGPITKSPTKMGRMMLFTSNRGDIRLIDINPADDLSPIRISSSEKYETGGIVRSWTAAAGSDIYIGGKGLLRYKISRATGVMERMLVANSDDIFLGTIYRKDDVLFHLRRRRGSSMVSVAAVNSENLKEIWRTDFGAPMAGNYFQIDNLWHMVNSQGDLLRINNDGQVENVARASQIDEVLSFDRSLPTSEGGRAGIGKSMVIGDPNPGRVLNVTPDGSTLMVSTAAQPADSISANAIVIGDDLIVPTSQGPLLRIDPKTGQYAGSPFLPPMSPSDTIAWTSPAPVTGNRFLIGDGKSQLWLLDGSQRSSLSLAAELTIDGSIRSAIVSLGSDGFVVTRNDSGLKLTKFSTDGSSIVVAGNADLDDQLVQDPLALEDLVLVSTGDGNLNAFDSQLQLKWKLPIDSRRIASVIRLANGTIVVSMENGTVHFLDQSGKPASEVNVGQSLMHDPVERDGQLLFPAADGTMLILGGSVN